MSQSLDPSYVHRDKAIAVRPALMAGARLLKWYDIAADDLPVPEAAYAMARDFLARADLSHLGELGFVVLHRCGADFYFLLACSWRGNNEIWESVYARDAGDAGFREFPHPGPHRGTYCVWEMGAVAHESRAWRRYLLSKRDHAARETWLEDQYEGVV
jgi:hypothetical protein